MRSIVLAFIAPRAIALSSKATNQHTTSRRDWITKSITSSILICSELSPSSADADVDVLPSKLRQFTALAPLGDPMSTGTKTPGLSLADLASRLSHDLVDGSSGKGGYFISGDISTDIFRDDCTFTDPTNSVSSLSRYQNALNVLFDPSQSYVQLIEPLEVNEATREITARIRSGGVLKLPWEPRISTFESIIKYKVDEDGLIMNQLQDWNKPASKALQETFTPSALSAPYSSLSRPDNEPKEVTKLFELINGRRADSFSQQERFQIADLIEQISRSRYEWNTKDLPGKWALVYLQPGPKGGGIDRRIPFPDLWFNNNYQIFSTDSVTNVGELFGPLLGVRVGGSLVEEDKENKDTPKRYRANIEQGGLCIGDESKRCIPLPIRGEGLFDGVYLGERIRIGQNLNGTGARVVQIKIV